MFDVKSFYDVVLAALLLAGLGKSIFDPAIQAYVGQRVPFQRHGVDCPDLGPSRLETKKSMNLFSLAICVYLRLFEDKEHRKLGSRK